MSADSRLPGARNDEPGPARVRCRDRDCWRSNRSCAAAGVELGRQHVPARRSRSPVLSCSNGSDSTVTSANVDGGIRRRDTASRLHSKTCSSARVSMAPIAGTTTEEPPESCQLLSTLLTMVSHSGGRKRCQKDHWRKRWPSTGARFREWAEHAGQYVLIKGEEIGGFYSSYDDALTAGYEKFGLTPFFVKQISVVEQAHHITRFIEPCRTSQAR